MAGHGRGDLNQGRLAIPIATASHTDSHGGARQGRRDDLEGLVYVLLYLLLIFLGMSVTARYYVGYSFNIEMQPKTH